MACHRPALFAPGAPLWTDEHISAQMLAAHLDPSHDAASRRPETIDREVAWLVSHLGLRPGSRVLDLGCGPGLYCLRLARRGLVVTGIDISARSLTWAREAADRDGSAVEYLEADYLTWTPQGRFDAILLVYFDLGALADDDRDRLLCRVRSWLAPGGRFVFDVVSTARAVEERRREQASQGGFWRPGSHHVTEETFVYADEDASVDQYTVRDELGRSTVYRTWERRYTVERLEAALAAAGLRPESVWSDLTGTPYEGASESIAIVASPALSPVRG